MNKPKKLFLIDGMAVIYRSYYAMISNPLIASNGLNTSAIYGFINTILKLIKDENPEYLSVVMDTKAKTFRHQMYDDYKATRKPMPDDLSEQIKPIYDFLEALNMKFYKKDGYEADDILGTIAKKIRNEKLQVYLYSSDKDLMQLVDENIFIYSPGNRFSKTTIYNEIEVFEKWKVYPNEIVDYLSLLGDTSDNVPGVKGVGKKTATTLISEYHSIENLYESINNIKNEKMKQKLENSKDNAFLSKKLIKLDLNVDVDFDLEDMNILNISFENILNKLHDLDIYTFDKVINKKKIDTIPFSKNVKKNYKTILIESDLNKLLIDIKNYNEVSIDLETTDIDPNKAKIVGISLSYSPNSGYYIPFLFPEKKVIHLEEKLIFKKIKNLLESGSFKFIGQNIKYDTIVFKRYGIELSRIFFDTMIAESLISPEKNSYKLDILALDYLNYNMIPIEELIGDKKQNQIGMESVPLNDVSFYACEDSDVTLQIFLIQKDKIKKSNFSNLFYEVEIPLIKVLSEMEFNGVYIDVPLIKKLSEEIKIELKDITNDIYSISGKEFNMNSPKQLAVILFDELQLKKIKKRSTSVDVLERLTEYHPIIKLVLKYRHLAKLVNTYLDKLPNYVNSETNRVHTSFNQAVVSTGRLSSNKPNFQNIPIKSKIGKQIRETIKSQSSDDVIVSFDYSQIELRILAHFSNEKNLIEAFNRNIDIHSRTAGLIYGLAMDEVEENHRRVAKIINYSIVYGAGPYRISQELKISMKEAIKIIENYFMRYPGIKKYIEDTIFRGTNEQYVSTFLGRRRNTINLRSSNRNIVEAEKRASINMPIQGTASELIKVAMNNIYYKMKNNDIPGKMILQVHDELLFEVSINSVEILIKLVVEEMENSIKFKVPIKVDYNYGNNWFEAH